MRTSLMFILSIMITACSGPKFSQDLSVETSASGKEKQFVSESLQFRHNKAHPNCSFQQIISSKIINKTPDESIEKWTIRACSGREYSYRVRLIFDNKGDSFLGKGALIVDISNEDGSLLPLAP